MAFISLWLGNTYNTSPWSVHARTARGANDDFTLVNYATFWWFCGPLATVFHSTASSNVYHSEKQVWMTINGFGALARMNIPSWRTGEMPSALGRLNPAGVLAADGTFIGAVYTERQPCGSCSPFLNDVLPNNTLVGWHFPYVSKETKKHKHGDDDIATNALLAISKGKTYDQNVKDHQRDYRKEGNASLKESLKGMTTSHLNAMSPPLLATRGTYDSIVKTFAAVMLAAK